MANYETFFSPGGGAGAASTDYLKDNFLDTTLPATINTGFSNTVLKNPFNKYFLNDDTSKYGAKILWVKDLVRVEDRTKWVNGLETYQVIFHENFPGIFAYCFGNVRLLNYQRGLCASVRDIDDGVGVCGTMQRVGWILNTSENTGTADILTDGADTGTDITFGSALAAATGNQGINNFQVFQHQTVNDTKDLHDFRLTANNDAVMQLAGLVVYYENATADIDQYPGNSYVNKDKKTTTTISTLSVPSITGYNGANSLIYKTSNNAYAISTVETQSLSTIGQGTSGANTITVTTGEGSSFAAGMGIVALQGSSHYLGSITSVSTDTLTVAPTLGFGYSNVLYKAWYSGPTVAINASLYRLAYSFDPEIGFNQQDPYGFGLNNSTNVAYYQDPLKRFRVFGKSLTRVQIDGYAGLGFGVTAPFLQVEGRFSAAELEYIGTTNTILHATFRINDRPGYGVNEFVTNIIAKTVFTDAGPGFNIFNMTVGTSMGLMGIKKINFYERDHDRSVSYGGLAEFDTMVSKVNRNAVNMSGSVLGTFQRVYADELYLRGDWTRGVTSGAAGGVQFLGVSNSAVADLYFYGKDFAIMGVASSSAVVTLNGVAFNATFNVMQTAATLGFHQLRIQHQNGTMILEAVDYTRTGPLGFKSLINMAPVGITNIPQVYTQSSTPRGPKDGDIWAQHDEVPGNYPASVWMYLNKKWNKLNVLMTADDPNVSNTFVRTHGQSSTGASFSVQDAEHFNFTSWSTGQSDAATAVSQMGSGVALYANFHRVIGGLNTALSAVTQHRRYNKVAWSADVAITTAMERYGMHEFNNYFYVCKGTTTNGDAGGTANFQKFNGSSWSSGSVGGVNASGEGCFKTNNLLSSVQGIGVSPNNFLTEHQQLNTADTNSAGTAYPSTSTSAFSATRSYINDSVSAQSNTSNVYSWNGNAWSSSIAGTQTRDNRTQAAAGFSPVNQKVWVNGGIATNPINKTFSYNGSSISSDVASSTSRGDCVGSIL